METSCVQVLRMDRHWAAFLEHCKGLGGILQDGSSPERLEVSGDSWVDLSEGW